MSSAPGLKPGPNVFGQPTQMIFNDCIVATGNGAGTTVQCKCVPLVDVFLLRVGLA